MSHIDSALRKVNVVAEFQKIAPEMFLVGLVAVYDGFLGNLLKECFTLKPEIISGSEKPLTLAELKTLGSVDRATEYVMERETENILRGSHAQQFDWLKKQMNIY